MSKLGKKGVPRFISLNIKMTVTIMIGILLALGMYALCKGVEHTVANKFFLSNDAVEKTIGEKYDSLESYVKKNDVDATDSKKLTKWMQDQEYTYLSVYDNYNNIFEAGWWVDSSGAVSSDFQDDQSTVNANKEDRTNGPRIDKEGFQVDVKNRIVQFDDGPYYVFIDTYREEHWYNIMDLVTIILCFLSLLATLLIYNKMMIRRIIRLSEEARKVTEGDLKHTIHGVRNDEIGTLAIGVDDMRDSIIEKLQNEREAWDANTQLITAMSHDIRTPLTSLIGYLDIIDGKKYNSQEELDKFVESCRDKAFQLKDLSDKLFQYFLVFGNQNGPKELETLDAGIFFQQLLMEHVAEVTGYGYHVELDYTIAEEIFVKTEISLSRRLFDNLFSNILKYADKNYPINIKAYAEDGMIFIHFDNRISDEAKKVESTRIGVKTCERICQDLGGKMTSEETEKIYSSSICFPMAAKEPEPTPEQNTEEKERITEE